MIIDSHFHTLSMLKRGERLPEGLIGIDIGLGPGDYPERLKALPPSRKIFCSIASGPWRLDEEDFVSPEEDIAQLEKEAELYSPDAIGECGFDRHWKYGTPELQRELFLLQAELASRLSLPLIIHTRDADSDIEEAFNSSSFRCKAVMHCFSSGPELCRKALDKGLYISFAGNVTYKGNQRIRDAAKLVPPDRILVETDSPYLAPVPMRGRPCNPSCTEYTLDALSDARGEDRETLKSQIERNLYSFLGHEESERKLCLP